VDTTLIAEISHHQRRTSQKLQNLAPRNPPLSLILSLSKGQRCYCGPFSKKITPTYPTPSHLAYSDGVLSGGNALENFRSQERIGDFICGENPTAGEAVLSHKSKTVIETGDPGVSCLKQENLWGTH
jgi:hypothetical protein